MRLAGVFLLFSGWLIVFAAVALLAGKGARGAFAICGLLVELLGLALVTRSHLVLTPERE